MPRISRFQLLLAILALLVGGFWYRGRLEVDHLSYKVQLTRLKLLELDKAIKASCVESGSLPMILDSLPEVKRLTLLLDAFGRPIGYEPSHARRTYRLTSLGADGKLGGEGVDADIGVEGKCE